MGDCWTSFARQGAPEAEGAPRWPRYDPARDLIMDFADDGPVVVDIPHRQGLDAIAARRALSSSEAL